jgi:aerotolerance regulator-like protein/VWA domain-containing protein
MGLLTPWFLAGLAAVGLPIWIHLLKRHKTDPTPFPSLMFFEQREQSSVKHRRLEYLLLWALRMAMIILLALLFANPYIRRAIPVSEGKKLTVIAVDQSFSMRATGRLASAKDQALQVVSSLGPGAQAQVVALGARVQAMTQVTSDPAELRAAINSIQASDSRASFGELARYARTLSESTHLPIQLDLCSDLQKSALPPGFADLRLNPDTTLVLHPAGGAAPNWAVENVVAPQRIYDPKRVRIQATITGFGAPASKRNVSLILNGKILQTKTVDVPEGGRAQVEFLALDAPYGFSKGEVRIDSGDVLAADDRFPFAVERTDPRKVLFLDDGRRPRAQLYYRAALDSSPDAAFQMEALRPEQAAGAPLSNYAFIVLSDLGSIPQGLEDALRRYVAAGGSVLIALGPASAVLPRVPVLDESIEAARYAGREAERFLSVSDADAGHPALRSAGRFEAVKFYQVIHVTPAKSRVLVRLNDQTPLVLERQIGEGKALVFASTFDNVSNDLPLHAAWVPFIQQSAAYLSGGSGGDQPVNLPVDSYVELRTTDNKSAGAEVLDPDGKRLLSLEEATSAKNFAVAREGFFEMKTASGRRSLIAAHADRRESDLGVIPQESLDLWKATGRGDQASGETPGPENASDKKPWGLWPFLLLLLLGVAIAESVVANGYLRPPAEQLPGTKKEAA